MSKIENLEKIMNEASSNKKKSETLFEKNLKLAIKDFKSLEKGTKKNDFEWNKSLINKIIKNPSKYDPGILELEDKNQKTPLSFTIEYNLETEFDDLLFLGADPNNIGNSRGILHIAVEEYLEGKNYYFDKIIQNKNIDFSILNKNSESIIEIASFNDMEITSFLIEKGATVTNSDFLNILNQYPDYLNSINIFDYNNKISLGKLPEIKLGVSSWFGYILNEAVEQLNFELYSNILNNFANNPNFNINTEAALFSIYGTFDQLIFEREERDFSEKVINFFLSINNIDWNKRIESLGGDTLIFSFLNNQFNHHIDGELFKKIIEKSNINCRNFNEETPLMTFIKNYNDENQSILFLFLNSENIDLSAKNALGKNIFEIAKDENNGSFEALVEECSNVIIKNNFDNQKKKSPKL